MRIVLPQTSINESKNNSKENSEKSIISKLTNKKSINNNYRKKDKLCGLFSILSHSRLSKDIPHIVSKYKKVIHEKNRNDQQWTTLRVSKLLVLKTSRKSMFELYAKSDFWNILPSRSHQFFGEEIKVFFSNKTQELESKNFSWFIEPDKELKMGKYVEIDALEQVSVVSLEKIRLSDVVIRDHCHSTRKYIGAAF